MDPWLIPSEMGSKGCGCFGNTNHSWQGRTDFWGALYNMVISRMGFWGKRKAVKILNNAEHYFPIYAGHSSLSISFTGWLIIHIKVWLSGNNGICWCRKIKFISWNEYALVAPKLTSNAWQFPHVEPSSSEMPRLWEKKNMNKRHLPWATCKNFLQKHVVNWGSCFHPVVGYKAPVPSLGWKGEVTQRNLVRD